jgi:F0F1-type ATP synthase assembly protein I
MATGGDRDADGRNAWLSALRFATVGIEFGLGAGLGYLAGNWLDTKFDTKPALTLVMLLFGIAAAFASLIHRVQEAQREQEALDQLDERPETGTKR